MWIVTAAVLFVIWAVIRLVGSAEEIREKIGERGREAKRNAFIALIEPDRDFLYGTSEFFRVFGDEKEQTVVDFMEDSGVHSEDWRRFARFFIGDAAKMIVLARCGKIDTVVHAYYAPWGAPGIVPPWKAYEMTEKFLLRIEDTLRENGVETRVVANYGKGPSVSAFVPVRDHTRKHGYGADGFIHGGLSFEWEQLTYGKVVPVS